MTLRYSCRGQVNRTAEVAVTRTKSSGIQPVLLTKSRLRKGCHCHKVQSILYITQDQLGEAVSGLGQVRDAVLMTWWV